MRLLFVVMSCSQFIEHEDEDKSDTLVIIVNGDGTVTVDPRTLERVLSKRYLYHYDNLALILRTSYEWRQMFHRKPV